MKNIKYIFLALVLGVLGCSDLDENPQGALSPDGFVTTPNDIQTLVNGAIGAIANEQYWGRKMSLSLLLRGDMCDIGDTGTPARRQDVNNFTMADDNGMVTAFWGNMYLVIGTVNQAISAANDLDVTPEQIDPIKAQAHFFRAHTYYHLVRLFGDIPYIEEPFTSVTESKEISKMSAADVYANIILDLEEAKRALPDTQPTRALPSKATAAAYLASVHLTLGNYQDAYDEAKFVIDNEGTFGLGLELDFQDLFNADKQGEQSEVLLALDYNAFRATRPRGQPLRELGRDYIPALTGIRSNESPISSGGWSVAVPSIEVYNRWDGRDYRKAVSLDTTAVFDGVTTFFTDFQGPTDDARNRKRAYIAKYTRFIGDFVDGNGRSSSLNYPFMRYAEVLLTAAEALNEINPGSPEADGYVNRVRARARGGNGSSFPPDLSGGLSQDDFRNMVLEERRWELAFEFKRWYDIKRREIGLEAFGPGSFEPHDNFDPARDYLFPLPNDELLRNPNLAPNNPGY